MNTYQFVRVLRKNTLVFLEWLVSNPSVEFDMPFSINKSPGFVVLEWAYQSRIKGLHSVFSSQAIALLKHSRMVIMIGRGAPRYTEVPEVDSTAVETPAQHSHGDRNVIDRNVKNCCNLQ